MKCVSPSVRNLFERILKARYLGSILIFVSFVVLALLRIRNSFDRMAPDPGFWFLEQVRENNYLHVFSNQDGFLHVAPRLCFEFVSLFPIQYQAIAGTVGMQLIFGCVAASVFLIIRTETQKFWLSLFGAVMVVAVPAAGESTVGNLGSVKWPLTILLVFVLASKKTMLDYTKLSVACAILVGLSQPYSILLTLPAFIRRYGSKSKKSLSQTECCVAITGFVQLAVWFTSGVTLQKYGEPTYLPWSGMGVFWYSIWITPTLSGICVFLFLYLLHRRGISGFEFELRLASATVLLAVVAYLQLGIKDSSSVAPQAVSWVVLLLTVFRVGGLFGRQIQRLSTAILLVFVLTATVKWFGASWFLTSGPTWSSEIERARALCLQDDLDDVVVKQFMSDTTLDCEQILEGA